MNVVGLQDLDQFEGWSDEGEDVRDLAISPAAISAAPLTLKVTAATIAVSFGLFMASWRPAETTAPEQSVLVGPSSSDLTRYAVPPEIALSEDAAERLWNASQREPNRALEVLMSGD